MLWSAPPLPQFRPGFALPSPCPFRCSTSFCCAACACVFLSPSALFPHTFLSPAACFHTRFCLRLPCFHMRTRLPCFHMHTRTQSFVPPNTGGNPPRSQARAYWYTYCVDEQWFYVGGRQHLRQCYPNGTWEGGVSASSLRGCVGVCVFVWPLPSLAAFAFAFCRARTLRPVVGPLPFFMQLTPRRPRSACLASAGRVCRWLTHASLRALSCLVSCALACLASAGRVFRLTCLARRALSCLVCAWAGRLAGRPLIHECVSVVPCLRRTG